jgi:8-oxo-dGTP pyrophosphatase MutT (NUDIX family)
LALLDHIRRCNAYDPARFRPWTIDGQIAGRLHRDLVDLLSESGYLVERGGALALAAAPSFADRSAALHRISRRLDDRDAIPGLHGEMYAVDLGGTTVAQVDRNAVPALGVHAWGCHVNGYVRKRDGLYMWVARRSPAKSTFPNELDNLAAGGQPHGIDAVDNMVKECGEEAGVPPELACRATYVGDVRYTLTGEAIGYGWLGLIDETARCYDLELPEDFIPKPVDGEVAEFTLLPLAEVADILDRGFEFKFNSALVAIDFLIRCSAFGRDRPDYADVVRGLRRTATHLIRT